jgi:signal transduction histidine kinase
MFATDSCRTFAKGSSDRQDVVLLVDDEPGVLSAMVRNLRHQPFQLYTARSADEAIALITSHGIDLIVSDENMPGMLGTEFLAWVAREYPSIVRIVLTGTPNVDSALRALNEGEVYRFLTRPCDVVSLAMTIRTGLEHKRLVEANRRLLETTRRQVVELERSNRELVSFAAVVSHDLKAPLQSIKGFCELVRDVSGEQLDVESAEFLDLAMAATDRLASLVDAVLEYSRVGRSNAPLEMVDLESAARCAIDSLAASIHEAGARLLVGRLPTVRGSESRLRQLLQNLISNAVKFRCPDQPPRIVVSCVEWSGEWRVSIADNGIGIPAEDQQRVFEAFQRAHGSQCYQGSGLGLATCQRIVEQHNGKIWIESRGGDGTTIHFTLPRAGAEHAG